MTARGAEHRRSARIPLILMSMVYGFDEANELSVPIVASLVIAVCLSLRVGVVDCGTGPSQAHMIA
jgi:hypothetical protein